MLEEVGGLVDENLKVYGASNGRVVDTSVLPFQACENLKSMLYAVTEKAADSIKAAM